MNAAQPHHVLLVRLDRMGDLVLTLPVDSCFRDANVQWWISPGLSFVTDCATPRRSAQEISRQTSFIHFFRRLRELRERKPDAVILFHAPWWVSLLVFLAGIPVRGGVKSRWHSFLFLNRAIRQKRSRAEHSELEYNYQLVERVFDWDVGSQPRQFLHLDAGSLGSLANLGLRPQKYSVVHPGMGGSALNWPTDRYTELITALADMETVVITGTASDERFLRPLRERLADDPRLVWLDGKLKGPELIRVLAHARRVVAPSTGVMHLAASTGRPTLGIFSPVRVQHPKRWGPQGRLVATILPQAECPGTFSCLGKTCPHHDCMIGLTSDAALSALNRLDSLPPSRSTSRSVVSD